MAMTRGKRLDMNDGYVVLGTMAIVGTVLVVTVALLFKRPFLLRGDNRQVEIRTGSDIENAATDPSTIARK
jgi:hypothetical protein